MALPRVENSNGDGRGNSPQEVCQLPLRPKVAGIPTLVFPNEAWSSVAPCEVEREVPVSRRLCRQPMPDSIGLKICTGTGLRVCRICIGPGRLPPLTHRHGVPSQGGFEQRSAHTFAEMVRAFVGEEKVTASAKARFQGRSAPRIFYVPEFASGPICAGTGLTLCHICTRDVARLARYAHVSASQDSARISLARRRTRSR